MEWDIKDIIALSRTCKALYHWINSFETYAMCRDLHIISRQTHAFLKQRTLSQRLSEFVKEEPTAPEISENTFKELTTYVKAYNDLTAVLPILQMNLEKSSRAQELWILDSLQPLFAKTTKIIDDLSSLMLTFAKENKLEEMNDDIIVDLNEISRLSGQPIPTYEEDHVRDYKKIFQKDQYIRIMKITTVLMATAYMAGGIYLYFQYPEKEVKEAFHAFMNKTSQQVGDFYWYPNTDDSHAACFEKYWFSTSQWDTYWFNTTGYDGRAAYCFMPNGQNGGHFTCKNGTVLQWLQNIASMDRFNTTFWLNHVMSVMNGTRDVWNKLICSPNPYGISISCGFAYSNENGHGCIGEACLSMTRGDAICAGNLAAQHWHAMNGVYWSVGGAGVFVFFWLWLIAIFL